MNNLFDIRQSVIRFIMSMVGGASGDSVDTVLQKVDSEFQKLFQDRNISLVDGGIVTFTGTQLIFTQNLNLVVNQALLTTAPAATVNLGSATISLGTNGDMWYAVLDRVANTATTATVGASTGLPAANSTNQDIILLAKRFDSADGRATVYFRNGFTLSNGQSARLGEATSAVTTSDDSTTTGANATLQPFVTGSIRLTNASLSSVSGIPAGGPGQIFTVENQTGSTITINNNDAGATASNRIFTGSGASTLMFNNATYSFLYDVTISKWMLLGVNQNALINPMTTQGDIIIGGPGGTPLRMGVGLDGQILFSNSFYPDGVHWDYHPLNVISTPGGSVPIPLGYDIINFDTSGGGISARLPSPSTIQGKTYTLVFQGGSNPLTIFTPSGTIFPDGTSSFLMTFQYESVVLHSDGTNWQITNRSFKNYHTQLASGSFTVPKGVNKILIRGCGGGGGGGSGSSGSAGTGEGGGGGGEAAMVGQIFADVNPGDVIGITIGAGGSGGAAAAAGPNNGNPGNIGSSTIVGSIITFVGGAGGTGGQSSVVGTGGTSFGGPGAGGNGGGYGGAPGGGNGLVGIRSPSQPGGAGGLGAGANTGGGGGGGGASSFEGSGPGGAGGNGGNGVSGQAGNPGSFGSGGGGGGGLFGGSVSSTSGAGGTGGNGAVIISWIM